MGQSDGKTAVVTGAGRGIGRAIALPLAVRSARVALAARSADQLDQTRLAISHRGGTALAFSSDISDPMQVEGLLASIRDEVGILINNAGMVQPLGPRMSVAADEWAQSLAVNVLAPARLSFALLPGMIARGWGRIVNVSSGIVAHRMSRSVATTYVAGKAALEAHTIDLAAEVTGTGATVNVYRPGRVDTAMQE